MSSTFERFGLCFIGFFHVACGASLSQVSYTTHLSHLCKIHMRHVGGFLSFFSFFGAFLLNCSNRCPFAHPASYFLHSNTLSLFFAFLIGYFVSRCGSGWPGAKTFDKTLSLHTSRPRGARGVYPLDLARVSFSLSSFLCSLKNRCVPYRAV